MCITFIISLGSHFMEIFRYLSSVLFMYILWKFVFTIENKYLSLVFLFSNAYFSFIFILPFILGLLKKDWVIKQELMNIEIKLDPKPESQNSIQAALYSRKHSSIGITQLSHQVKQNTTKQLYSNPSENENSFLTFGVNNIDQSPSESKRERSSQSQKHRIELEKVELLKKQILMSGAMQEKSRAYRIIL